MRRAVETLLIAAALHAGAAAILHAQQSERAREGASEHALARIDTMALRAHTYFLSGDLLAGRGAGSEGERIAAEYIASQLIEIGLEPLGRSQFEAEAADAAMSAEPAGSAGLVGRRATRVPHLLPFQLMRADVSRASLEWVSAGEAEQLAHGAGFVVGRVGPAGVRAAEGAPLWLGTPEAALKGLAARGAADTLTGRWVVLGGQPGERSERLMPLLKQAGAVGVIALAESRRELDAWAAHLGPDRWMLAEQPDAPVWQPGLPVLLAGPQLAARLGLSADAPSTEAETPAAGEPRAPGLDAPRLLAGRLRFEPNARAVRARSMNVAGVLAGADPERRDEIVLYTAHYDHLGVRAAPAGGDSIYNGFSDNAAGVAMLLDIARAMAEDRPERSVAFVFFGAEEVGLLGSTAFAQAPPVPLEQIVALINLDAGAPPAPPAAWRLAGVTRSGLEVPMRRLVEAHGWRVRADAGSPNSDHWPFARRGVPVAFLIPDGEWENVSEAEARQLRERWDRYHRLDDEWSAAFPFAGLARYAALALEMGVSIANGSRRYR